jgi:hypothetical protein
MGTSVNMLVWNKRRLNLNTAECPMLDPGPNVDVRANKAESKVGWVGDMAEYDDSLRLRVAFCQERGESGDI